MPMKKKLDHQEALRMSVFAYREQLKLLREHEAMASRAPAPDLNPFGTEPVAHEAQRRYEQLQQETYEALTKALFCLGMASVEWIAPRSDLGRFKGAIQPAFAAASTYRTMHIDGISVLTSDGPFISGLAKRLGITSAEIYQEPVKRVSAFEKAFWLITERMHETNKEASFQDGR
ncbi:hypothetical protein ACEOSU_20770 [Pseudomonas aeruginosa]